MLGNLRRVTLSDGRVITYDIDPQNRRIGKSIDGARTFGLLYEDARKLVAMLDGQNNVLATFVYGTEHHVPDYMNRGGQTYRLVVDHLGSVRLVVNVTDGNLAQRLDYDAYGNVLTDTNPGFQPFGFAGGLYDWDTKLVHFGARDYDAATGRWTGKDPILFRGTAGNLYQYAKGEPVDRIDPSGLVDIFFGLAIDLIVIFGIELGGGIVIDTDHPGESGLWGNVSVGGFSVNDAISLF